MPIVLLSGGTGFIGTHLTHYLIDKGYEVVILSRKKNNVSVHPKVSYSVWDVEKKIIDAEVVCKADYIIHLAGTGVMDAKWTKEYRKIILESRTKSAELIISCLNENPHHVMALVSASAIGWYGWDDSPLQREEGFEETDLPDDDFLGTTCVLWEAAVNEVTTLGVRLVKLRTGIVLGNDGGAFKEFKKPLRFGLAPVLGNGKQVMSWIHIDDLCRMFVEAIENNYLNGTYNAVASQPVSQRYLELILAEKVRHKFYIPVFIPSFLLKLFLGKRSVEILKSATVSNQKIKATGFTFLYPTIEPALEDLIKPKR